MSQFASTLYPQTNPTNAILLNLRMDAEHVSIDWSPERFSEWLADETSVPGQYPPAQIEHASRVLHRLASLTG